MDNKTSNLTTFTQELAYTATPVLTPAQFVIGFLKWWYIGAITSHLRFFKRLVELLMDRLSITLLLRTFFVPWHRQSSAFGLIFGITMRLLWLPLAFLIIFLVIAVGIIFIITWVFLPIVTIFNIIFFWI